MSVLDDICFQMHGQSEGADVKLLDVSENNEYSVFVVSCVTCVCSGVHCT